MSLNNFTRAMALSVVATFGTGLAASAAVCNISMPASGGNARVASVNANIVNVLQTQYPGVSFDAPTSTQSSSVTVPNCNAADFTPTGANVSNVGGGVPAGGGNINQAAAAAGAAALLALVVVLGDSSNTSSSSSTN